MICSEIIPSAHFLRRLDNLAVRVSGSREIFLDNRQREFDGSAHVLKACLPIFFFHPSEKMHNWSAGMKKPATQKRGGQPVADTVNITIRERATGRKLNRFDCPRHLFVCIERDARYRGTTWGQLLRSLLRDRFAA